MSRAVHDRLGVSRRQFLAGAGVGVTGLSVWGLEPLVDEGDLPAERPDVVGHRGAEGLAPPNTLAAIRAALDVGVDGIELDVWRSSDGELVLFHDAVLDWDSTGSGWIESTPWSAIEGATIRGEPIVTLPRALSVLSDADVDVYLELKTAGYTETVIETVAAHGLSDRLTIISLEPEPLEPALSADVRTGFVGSAPTPWLAADAADLGVDVTMSHYAPRATAAFLDAAAERGLDGGIWKLVETERTLRDALEVGPDVVVTNHPDEAVDVLDGRA